MERNHIPLPVHCAAKCATSLVAACTEKLQCCKIKTKRYSLAISRKEIAVALISCMLAACSFTHRQDLDNIDTTNLAQLESVHSNPLTSSDKRVTLGALRAKSLHDFALGTGAQGGLASASKEINMQMEKDGKYLESIYNFNGMMLTHGVLPPVLEEGDNTLNLENSTTIRVSDRTYTIAQQARFATTAPHWREYLILAYNKPTLPDRSLLPRTSEEQAIWRRGVRIGWEKGIEQAHNIFQQNLARLKRDFRGMALYRKLLQQKIISAPFVARTELGITGTGDDMRVNDQVLRIVELPQLQTNSDNWNAVVVKK